MLGSVALVSNKKYGLWTATVLPNYAAQSGILTFDTIHLSLSHFGMRVQAMMFSYLYRPGLAAAAAALESLLFQDYVDYWLLDTRPSLPTEWFEPKARSVATRGGWHGGPGRPGHRKAQHHMAPHGGGQRQVGFTTAFSSGS